MRVVIVNCYNDNNRGSAALNFAAIEMVMRAFGQGVDISLVPLAHDDLSSSLAEQFRHTVKRFPEVAIADPVFDPGGSRLESVSALRHWWRASGSLLNVLTLERIVSADLVVSRGGVILHGRTSGVGGTGSLATRTMALRAAQELGVRTVVYGAQVGPFLSKGSARLATKLLSSAQLSVIRDRTSDAIARRIAPTATRLLTPDSALRLSVSDLPSSGAVSPKRLGVVVSSAGPFDKSRALEIATHRIDDVIRAAAPEEVRFFVQVNGRASSDVAITEAVAERIDPRSAEVQLCPDFDLDPFELIAEYSKCSLVVSSRLHATILSLLGGTPAISLPTGLTFKEGAVLETAGLDRLVSRSDETLNALVSEITESGIDWRGEVRRRVQSAREQILKTDSAIARAWRQS